MIALSWLIKLFVGELIEHSLFWVCVDSWVHTKGLLYCIVQWWWEWIYFNSRNCHIIMYAGEGEDSPLGLGSMIGKSNSKASTSWNSWLHLSVFTVGSVLRFISKALHATAPWSSSNALRLANIEPCKTVITFLVSLLIPIKTLVTQYQIPSLCQLSRNF